MSDRSQRDAKREAEHERLSRNWNELLQELRVTQTGTQILTAFLLTVPFQSRFTDLSDYQVGIYLALLSGTILVTVLGLTPVILHRRYFRKGEKPHIVAFANRMLQATFIALGAVLVGIVIFVFDVVTSLSLALVAGGAAIIVLVGVWFVLPSTVRPRLPDHDGDRPT